MNSRCKTEECLWCGGSEASGVELRSVTVGGRIRHECLSPDECRWRINIRLVRGIT